MNALPIRFSFFAQPQISPFPPGNSKESCFWENYGKFVAIVALITLAACSGDKQAGLRPPPALASKASVGFQPQKINSVGILELESDDPSFPSDSRQKELTQRLVNAFAVGTTMEIKNLSTPEESAQAQHAADSARAPQRSRAADFGRQLSAQGVLYGRINRYSESDGGKFGANTPANVSFSLWLIRSETKEVLWTASYFVREQPLSDNLLRVPQALSEGITYRGSRQTIETGFRQAAEALENLRREKAN